MSVAAALRRQLDARPRGARRIGWKIGHDIAEAGDELVLGHLTSATLLGDGAAFSAGATGDLRAESEVAVVVGGGLCLALELVDVARPPGGLEGIVETNVFHRAVVLGAERAGLGAQARLRIDGEVREAVAAEVDAGATIATAARLLAEVGERVEPGDRILAGSLCHVPVRPGQVVNAEIDGLGALAVRVVG